jgi:type IV pilus assembly protein PilA
MVTRTKKAFTLLELIVVLLVLGILAAIAVPTFNRVKENSVKKTAETNAQAIYRNAQAIAASDPGAVLTKAIIETAAGESDATSTVNSDGLVVVSATSGSITCTVLIDLGTGPGAASC